MKELSKEAIEKMDSVSRAQYYRIQKDNEQTQANQEQSVINQGFEERIKELEDAREVQIRVNSQLREAIGKLNQSPSKSWWPF